MEILALRAKGKSVSPIYRAFSREVKKSISLCEKCEINFKFNIIGFLWASSAHKVSCAKMVVKHKKQLAKMEFLVVCG